MKFLSNFQIEGGNSNRAELSTLCNSFNMKDRWKFNITYFVELIHIYKLGYIRNSPICYIKGVIRQIKAFKTI